MSSEILTPGGIIKKLERFPISHVGRKKLENPEEVLLRLMTDDDYDQVLEVQSVIMKNVSDQFEFTEYTREDIEWYKNNGRFVLAFHNDLLAAYISFSVNRRHGRNYCDILKYPKPEVCANINFMIIHPLYQRNQLGPKIVQESYDYWHLIEKRSQYFSTVYPLNYRTLYLAVGKNLFKTVALKPDFYGPGFHRYIYMVDMNKGKEKEPENKDEIKCVEMKDFETQVKLFEDGYVGYDVTKTKEGKWIMKYKKGSML